MEDSNEKARKYYGKFAIEKLSPPNVVKDAGPGLVIDSSTLNIVVPIEEVKNLINALTKAYNEKPNKVNLKIELRETKRRKSDDLFPGTVTYSPYD